MEPTLIETLKKMPKVELHAHLNGSISKELLNHLKAFSESDDHSLKHDEFPPIHSKGVLMPSLLLPLDAHISEESSQGKSLKECWDAFASIHEVIRTPRILYVATVNVIADFSRDNVIYLELRTSPKKIHNIPTKLAYLEAVLKAIKDGQEQFPISVKLLISIDRKNGEKDGLEIIQLASEIGQKFSDIMVGIDVSGDPRCGHSSWIVRVMQEARKKGLKISCHLPEIVNPQEGMAFLEFGPERLGHGQFLHPFYGGTDELWNLVKLKRIPIECCISSNLVSGVAASVETHVIKILHEEKIPFVICTDDSGVFSTSLSAEFMKVLGVIPLSLEQIRDLCIEAASYAFTNDEEKNALKNMLQDWWAKRFL